MSFYETLSAQFATRINSGTGLTDVISVVTGFAMAREIVMTTAVVGCETAGLFSVMTAGKRHTGWSDRKWKLRKHSSTSTTLVPGLRGAAAAVS